MEQDTVQQSVTVTEKEQPNDSADSLGSILSRVKKGDPVASPKPEPAAPAADSPPQEDPGARDSGNSVEDAKDWKTLYEKKDQSFRDTQKWGMTLQNKIKVLEGKIQEYQNSGTLSDDEAKTLLEGPAAGTTPHEVHPSLRLANTWDQEIPNMRKYSTNPDELDKDVLGFQAFYQFGKPDHVESILETLAQEKDALHSTRQMLEHGRAFRKAVLDDIWAAGGLEEYKKKQDGATEKLKKENEKLKTEIGLLKKHDTYDPDVSAESADYQLPTGKTAKDVSESSASLGSILTKARRGGIHWG